MASVLFVTIHSARNTVNTSKHTSLILSWANLWVWVRRCILTTLHKIPQWLNHFTLICLLLCKSNKNLASKSWHYLNRLAIQPPSNTEQRYDEVYLPCCKVSGQHFSTWWQVGKGKLKSEQVAPVCICQQHRVGKVSQKAHNTNESWHGWNPNRNRFHSLESAFGEALHTYLFFTERVTSFSLYSAVSLEMARCLLGSELYA